MLFPRLVHHSAELIVSQTQCVVSRFIFPFTRSFGGFHLSTLPLWSPGSFVLFPNSLSPAPVALCPPSSPFVVPRTCCAASETGLPVHWSFHSSQPTQKAPCTFPGSFVLLPRYFYLVSRQIIALHPPKEAPFSVLDSLHCFRNNFLCPLENLQVSTISGWPLAELWSIHTVLKITCLLGKRWLVTHTRGHP